MNTLAFNLSGCKNVSLFLEHDLSMAKYSRLSKKKENEKVRIPTFHVIFHFVYLSFLCVFLL